jgi:segregation and condensation protein B
MSRKRPEKSDSNELPDDDGEPGEEYDEEIGDQGELDEVKEVKEEEDEEEDFSLDQLSRAYARVLNPESEDSVDLESGENALVRPDRRAPKETDEIEAEQAASDGDEVDDDAACPISPESIIEAILFVGSPKDVKLTSRKIAAVLRDVSPKEVTKIAKKINSRYEQENAAYRISSDKGALKMVLDNSLNEFQQEFFGRNKQVRLSQAAIDVMAVVAYNQPLTREQVDKIRAKPSGSILAQLVRRNLLYFVPDKGATAKTRCYGTTDKFLDFFNLEEIADLPQSHEVSDIDELAD